MKLLLKLLLWGGLAVAGLVYWKQPYQKAHPQAAPTNTSNSPVPVWPTEPNGVSGPRRSKLVSGTLTPRTGIPIQNHRFKQIKN